MSYPGNIDKRFPWDERFSRYAIPVALGILALLIRAPGLGKWCITIDEFYFSQPVSFILERGVPELPGGGYYTRGILLQYLTVLPVLIFKKWEFSIRLLPLLFGSLTIPLFYLVCRSFLPTIPALFSSIILLLSSWHIEFSRFARFYAPFQFLFFLFLLLFYKGYWQNNRRCQFFSWFVAFLSIFVYEGAIFFPILLFLGLLKEAPSTNVKKRNMELFLVSAILLIFNYFINNYDWWFLEAKNTLPSFLSPAISESGSGLPIELPRMDLLRYVFNHLESTILYFGLFLVAWMIYFKQRKIANSTLLNYAIVIALFLPLLHLYALLIFVLVILFLCRDEIKTYFLEYRKVWVLYFVFTMVFWLSIIFFSGNMSKVLHFLVGFPPVKKSIIVPLYENVPLWGFFLLFPFVFSILHNVFGKPKESTCFILMVLLTLIASMPTLKTLWTTTRYIFFFYPLFIILIFAEINTFLESTNDRNFPLLIKKCKYVFYLLPFIVFLSSEDFHLFQVVHVSSKETNFRMGKYEKLSNHWYARVDLETPVKYVNNRYKDGDIVVLDDVIMSKYIEKPYVNFVSSEDDIRFAYHSREEGRIEKWSGRPLIYKTETFAKLVPQNGKNSLWLISSLAGGFIGTSFVQKSNTPYEIAAKYNLNTDLKYTGIDRRIGVWQFKNRECSLPES